MKKITRLESNDRGNWEASVAAVNPLEISSVSRVHLQWCSQYPDTVKILMKNGEAILAAATVAEFVEP